jgi:benzodiazapine receptor
MKRGHPAKTALPIAAAAVLGNAFIGRDSMAWFSALRRPAMQLPMPGFYLVGAAYYALMSIVVHRAVTRGDRRSYRLAMVVLAGNEVWNALLFGRRSTRDGFLGIVAFLVPLGLLQASVAKDRPSRAALSPYVAWVVFYDLPWTYQLWRLNEG